MDRPETRYARSGELDIAYSASGEGPHDILHCSNWTSHVEAIWDFEPAARLLRRLGRIGRVILFDLPGNGLSDPVSLEELPSIEQWMDCVRVVMDAAASERAVLFGMGAAAGLALPFAATHPDRVEALILHGGFARIHRADDYPHGVPEELREPGLAWWLERWGTGRQLHITAPELADDDYETRMVARFERYSASPGVARVFFPMISKIDVRDVLPAVRVPTLVMHREGDRWIDPRHGHYLAERIPDARHVALPGSSHYPFYGDVDRVVGEIRSFLDSLPAQRDLERMLATILITDIVGSTRRAAEVGDERWRALLDRHDAAVREQLRRFDGREIRSTGDGFMATFDGAARAVRCAAAIRDALRPLSLHVRAGLHSGEIERRAGGVDGLAVHLAARVADAAAPGQVLVSQTVKDLTIGARLEFEPLGTHRFEGVPGEWMTYAATV